MSLFDIAVYLLGIALLFIFFYFLGNHNNRKAKEKVGKFINDSGQGFYKIANKNCSVKRLTKANRVEIKDTSYTFDKCDLYIGQGFILIQGFKDDFFKSATRTFVIIPDTEKPGNNFHDWTILKPKLVEISQTQLKIVYTAKTNNSDYSLIITNLTTEECGYAHQIKNSIK